MRKFLNVILIAFLFLSIFGCGSEPVYNTVSIYSYLDVYNDTAQDIIKIEVRANGETDWLEKILTINAGETLTFTFGYILDFSTTDIRITFNNSDNAAKTINMNEDVHYKLTVNHTTDSTGWLFETL